MNEQRTPFDEGYEAGRRRTGTWLDCPYTSRDIIESMKKREWLRGFDAGRAAAKGEA